jgi:TRAP-type C4-dicarboxylate transport system substrate-binding protein
MESETSRSPDDIKATLVGDKTEYREAVRKQLNEEVKKIIELEMQKAAQELIEEHKKATRQVVEEYRAAIRQIVEEEKEEIWKKAENLKKSILQLGL